MLLVGEGITSFSPQQSAGQDTTAVLARFTQALEDLGPQNPSGYYPGRFRYQPRFHQIGSFTSTHNADYWKISEPISITHIDHKVYIPKSRGDLLTMNINEKGYIFIDSFANNGKVGIIRHLAITRWSDSDS